MSRRTEDDTGAQPGTDGASGDEQTEAIHVEAEEARVVTKNLDVLGESAVIISRPVAKAISLGLLVVLILFGFQTWQSYNQAKTVNRQGNTIRDLRCTVENQSDTLVAQADSLDQLVIIRKRQDKFNDLIRRLIVASQSGDQAQIDSIIDEFEKEQAVNGEDGAQGDQGPPGPPGTPSPTTTPAPSSTTTTTSSTTTTRRPILTIPQLPIVPIAESTEVVCEKGEKDG